MKLEIYPRNLTYHIQETSGEACVAGDIRIGNQFVITRALHFAQ